MPTATTPDGVTIAFRHHGGDGPRLLLAHATGFCGEAWRPVAARLTERFAVWSLDFRGHGGSGRPADGRFDWDGTALDVLTTLDSAGGGPWVGAGHSMGGAALLLAQQARPGAFAALWLFEPIVMDPSFAAEGGGGNQLAEQARRRRPSFGSRDDARTNYASKPPMASFDPAALDGYLDGALLDEPDGSVRLACRPADESQVYLMGARHHAWDHLGEVVVPVTVVAGSTERPGPSWFAEPISRALPHGRLEAHPELGHFAPFEHPGLTAGSIDAALAGPAGLSAVDPTIAP